MIDVKIKDRKKDVEMLRLALSMSGVGANYITCDLISKVLSGMKKKGGKFSLLDGAKIEAAHEKEWTAYFKKVKEIKAIKE
jgi:hypothetical protein